MTDEHKTAVMDALKLPDSISQSSSSSITTTSSSSSSNEGFKGIRRRLSCRIRKSWSFRKIEELSRRGRSKSDVGVYGDRLYVDDELNGPNAVTQSRSWHANDSSTKTLAQHALQLSTSLGLPSQPTPLVVADPPTDSDGSSDGAKLKPVILVVSAGNFSAGPVLAPPVPPSVRSAPASPLQPPQTTPSTVTQRSPNHDKSAKQQSSWSVGEEGALNPPPGGHKARQKKFNRHFPQAALDERVLNYYSCALVGDILLQGHLYITRNYFAFHSNVFGYVTKLLIPLSSVVRVTKEKTARIIPNAIGITTMEDKHVFASLLSRDTTYKLMQQVLKAFAAPIVEQSPEQQVLKDESEISLDEDSSWCSQSGGEDVLSVPATPLAAGLQPPPSPHTKKDGSIRHSRGSPRAREGDKPLSAAVTVLTRKPSGPLVLSHSLSRKRLKSTSTAALPATTSMPPPQESSHLLVIIASVLLVLLSVMAIVLFYRMSSTQSTGTNDDILLLKRGDDVYSQILKWHSQLHSKSALQVHEFLHSNLDQIAKVRQSLETLSMLIGNIMTDESKSRDGPSHSSFLGSGDHKIIPPNPESNS